MFSKRAGILVSKLGAEAHASAAGQENEKSTAQSRARKQDPRPFAQAVGVVDVLFCKAVGAVGLYHVHPCSSSCFPMPQQAFVGEMGQKRRLVAASSYVFEKGRNFSKQVGR